MYSLTSKYHNIFLKLVLIVVKENQFLENDLDLASYSYANCKHRRPCEESVTRIWQGDIFMEAKLNKLGSIVKGFTETAIGGSFHPTLAFGENRLIMSQRRVDLQ